MNNRKTLTTLGAGVISALALTSGIAFADDKAEVEMLLKAPHDISAAIKAAEASVGGSAMSASFDDDNGTGAYEIDVSNAGRKTEVTVDATTGEVIDSRDDGSDKYAVDLTQLGGDLAEIVADIESETGGKVMSIDTEHDNGQFSGMEIEIANSDGTTQEFWMNATDGKLVPSSD